MSQIIDGRAHASKMRDELAKTVGGLKTKFGIEPCIAVIQLGHDERTRVYVRAQEKIAAELGICYRFDQLDPAISQTDFIAHIERLNQDPGVTGILIQQPLPSHIDPRVVPHAIHPQKDIEGVHPENVGRTVFGNVRVASCTSLAVVDLIDSTGVDIEGKEAVIVGHSEVVGRPVSWLLLDRLATVCVCHVATCRRGHLEEHVRRAEVLVVAVGKPDLIKGEWVREGAIVVDVGINVVDGKVCGDVEYAPAAQRAGYITPVPGGVGPVTVAMLMKNAVELFKEQNTDGRR